MNDSQRAGRVGAVADLVAISLRSVNARLPEVDANDGAIDLDLSWESSHLLPDPTAFGQISATFSAFPYARELVQSLTTRASLAPLVLGVLRAPIDPPVVDASE